MSSFWTQTTESALKRNVLNCPECGGRETRAELLPFRPLLELQTLYYGGEVTAG